MTGHNNGTDLLRRLKAGGVPRLPKLQRRADTKLRPASNAQQRLWFLRQLEGDVATYSVPQAYRVVGKFSLEHLDHALSEIVARHEAIRTRLFERHGQVWQEVLPPMPVHSKCLEASSLSEAIEKGEAEIRVAFDLSCPPMLRSVCVRIGPEEALLVFIFHHAAFDAWSLGVFYSELQALYRSHSSTKVRLTAPPYQFGDYADWQRVWLESSAAQAQRAYWREQLAGPLPILRLDYACAPRVTRSYSGAAQHFKLPALLQERVNIVAESHGTTVFIVLLAAFLAIIHRYSLQEDIVVGVPVACRSFAETEGIIGYLSNTLSLRSALSGRLPFSDLIAQTSKTFFDGLINQEVPFDQVVDSVTSEREPADNPIYQAMFVMQNTPTDTALRLEGAELEDVPVHTGTAKIDLTCSIRATAAGVEGELEYSTDVLSKTAAERFVAAFLNLLSDATLRPSACLDELLMVSSTEREALLEIIQSSFEEYPDFQPVHTLFESQAHHHPDAVAVKTSAETIRYDTLNARANHLARRLIELGAGPESLIGVCLDRSSDLVVALLSTLKTGAAFVPLDPSFPIERSRNICEDAGLLLVITQEQYQPLLASLPVPLLVERTSGVEGPAVDPCVPVAAENVAYVYYTSGSTGTPKGVVIDHGCAMNRIEWLRRRYPLNVGDRVLYKTPLIFDVAIWEIFGPLIAGATVLMADPGGESDVAHISQLLTAEHPVFAHFVPSMLEAYLNFAPQASYPGLRWIQLSGEAVPKRLYERFRDHFVAEFHNCYGQTETSEVAAWEGTLDTSASVVPIGKQIGVYRLYILDRALQPVPPGVPGELCVAGVGGLARGYYALPALTAEKFVPNPYALVPGERLYLTGDLARFTEEGVLEYLGRLDQQTKIRGCRVETTEVEAVLARHFSVRACAVVARQDEAGEKRLIAYVVSGWRSAAELAAHAERFLPRYMLPEAYIFLDKLPLTRTGKLDRMRLPSPLASDFGARVCNQAPQTPLEVELVEMWKQVLGLDRVGRTDNFFAIGGNSLKSMQVLVRLKEKFGIRVSVRKFFASPTIEGLAALTEQALLELVASMSDAEAQQRLKELEA